MISPQEKLSPSQLIAARSLNTLSGTESSTRQADRQSSPRDAFLKKLQRGRGNRSEETVEARPDARLKNASRAAGSNADVRETEKNSRQAEPERTSARTGGEGLSSKRPKLVRPEERQPRTESTEQFPMSQASQKPSETSEVAPVVSDGNQPDSEKQSRELTLPDEENASAAIPASLLKATFYGKGQGSSTSQQSAVAPDEQEADEDITLSLLESVRTATVKQESQEAISENLNDGLEKGIQAEEAGAIVKQTSAMNAAGVEANSDSKDIENSLPQSGSVDGNQATSKQNENLSVNASENQSNAESESANVKDHSAASPFIPAGAESSANISSQEKSATSKNEKNSSPQGGEADEASGEQPINKGEAAEVPIVDVRQVEPAASEKKSDQSEPKSMDENVDGSESPEFEMARSQRYGRTAEANGQPTVVPQNATPSLPADPGTASTNNSESTRQRQAVPLEAVPDQSQTTVELKRNHAKEQPLQAVEVKSPSSVTSQKADAARPVLDTTRNDMPQRLANYIQQAADQGKSLKIRLNPPELGTLQIEVSRTQGQISARLEVENAAARAVVFEHLSVLKETLHQQGLKIDQLQIEINEDLREQTSGQSSTNNPENGEFLNEREEQAHHEQAANLAQSEEQDEEEEGEPSRSTVSVDEIDVQV